MQYQDIHLEDKALWSQYQKYMAAGQYAEALALLENAKLANKEIVASLFNGLTTETVRLENQGKDSDFSKNTMAVAYYPPIGMTAGRCYCKIDSVLSGSNWILKSPNSWTNDVKVISVPQQQFSDATGERYKGFYARLLSSDEGEFWSLSYGGSNKLTVTWVQTPSSLRPRYTFADGADHIYFDGAIDKNLWWWLADNATLQD